MLRAARRQRVPPVGEGVDDDVRHAELGGQTDQRLDVALRRMDTAVGDEADEMDAIRAGEACAQHLVGRELPVRDRRVDARQVLADDGAGAEVEMAHLGVAHLPRRQPDGLAAGGQLRVRVARPEVVEDRRVGQRHRVPRPRLGQPPPVEDDQRDARERGHAAAAATIAAKLCGSSEAPPTRPPSTSGSASSSAALSGFIEPP